MTDSSSDEILSREAPISINSTLKGEAPEVIESNQDAAESETAMWIDNDGLEVKKVFGFNQNAELVNGRTAMIGFVMLLITELAFSGMPVTHSLFGIG